MSRAHAIARKRRVISRSTHSERTLARGRRWTPSVGTSLAAKAAVAARPQGLFGPGGSYMFAVRRRSDGHALLFNGPELGFTAPEKLVEIELRSPGVDLRGMTAPGVPVIGSGFNDQVAWGVTTGASDTDDLYAERLVPGHPEQYLYRGRVMQMDCVTERLPWGNPPSAPQPLAPGPARQRLRAAPLLPHDPRARTGARRRHRLRPPLRGLGSAEWRGFLTPSQMPHAIDPRQGWLANWNSLPSAGWTSGDGTARKRLDGPWSRAGLLVTLVKQLARQPTFTGMQDAIRQAGTIAQQFPRARRGSRTRTRSTTSTQATSTA
jgi:acyl-homoserine lactone acylase PvdQ